MACDLRFQQEAVAFGEPGMFATHRLVFPELLGPALRSRATRIREWEALHLRANRLSGEPVSRK